MEPLLKEPGSLKHNVLRRIEREGVCPRSRWQFVAKECLVWSAWLFAVLVAAVAVAISLFVILHRQYAVYEATHDSFLAFMLEVLPYLWFVVFAVCALLAVYHLRHTRRGYRYPLWGVVGVGMAASLAGGMIFHYVGMSYVLDTSLGHYVSGYWSQEKMEQRFWQHPEEGRILGTYQHELPEGYVILVRDAAGVEWPTDVSELFEADLVLLKTGKQVRLLGYALLEDGVLRFHACSVFPWMYDRMMTQKELYDSRELAILHLHQHRDRVISRLENSVATAEEGLAVASLPKAEESSTHCSTIAAVKRLRE